MVFLLKQKYLAISYSILNLWSFVLIFRTTMLLLARCCLNIGFNIQKLSVNVFQPVCAYVYACVFSMSYHLFNQANEWQPSMRRGGLIKAFPGTGDVQRKQQEREKRRERQERERGHGSGTRFPWDGAGAGCEQGLWARRGSQSLKQSA